MVLRFQHTIAQALQEIEFSEYYQFPIPESGDDLKTVHYGQAKWGIVDILNEKYSSLLLPSKFDLYNWIDGNENDEVAYFLNEAGSNTFSHSQFKTPSTFHLWSGKKGFVIAVQQPGKGFNAQEVPAKGGAFTFFESCKSTIFFDCPKEAKIVFMMCKI